MFNLIWIAVFAAAALGIWRQWSPAYILTLVLAIGGRIGNGVGHIALAVRAPIGISRDSTRRLSLS